MQIKNAFSQILCHANELDIRYMYFVDDSDNHQNIGVTGRSDLNQTVIVDVMRILYTVLVDIILLNRYRNGGIQAS